MSASNFTPVDDHLFLPNITSKDMTNIIEDATNINEFIFDSAYQMNGINISNNNNQYFEVKQEFKENPFNYNCTQFNEIIPNNSFQQYNPSSDPTYNTVNSLINPVNNNSFYHQQSIMDSNSNQNHHYYQSMQQTANNFYQNNESVNMTPSNINDSPFQQANPYSMQLPFHQNFIPVNNFNSKFYNGQINTHIPYQKQQELMQKIKRPTDAFLLFSNERRPELLQINPNLTEAAQTKLLTQEWTALSEIQKLDYIQRSRILKDTYTKSHSTPATSTTSFSTPISESKPIKNKDGPKRPMNAYLIFNKENRPKLLRANPNATTPEVSKAISDMWKALPPHEKKVYIDKANEIRQNFFEANPGYVFTRQCKNNKASDPINNNQPQRGRRKKDRNSEAPKHPMSAFLFYLVENRKAVIEEHGGNPVGPVSKIISNQWNALTDEQKRPWVEKAEEDKRRYARELKQFQISKQIFPI